MACAGGGVEAIQDHELWRMRFEGFEGLANRA